jgi:hypothetical protein
MLMAGVISSLPPGTAGTFATWHRCVYLWGWVVAVGQQESAAALFICAYTTPGQVVVLVAGFMHLSDTAWLRFLRHGREGGMFMVSRPYAADDLLSGQVCVELHTVTTVMNLFSLLRLSACV